MKQEEYRACMAKGLKGKSGLSRPERQLLFCVQSRLCSGKAEDEAEARQFCSIPKVPSPDKKSKRRSKKGAEPVCDYMSLMPHCEHKLETVVRSGELPSDTDITGICQLILG